ncbi:DUF5673 domain-containing protein [Nostoc sp. FACHB-133]|uniref:DUF5673 domain-containing protein n=1 Tax=Nostoc sp. FACHB-133 TaxID=2692835 RepID=UPI001688F43C|nr:DUF5673 domain-containing protein [Nostoc sp. FACHB-133]MBD2527397.1 hypothetical protein [Nostoc sp. FACHB-133]
MNIFGNTHITSVIFPVILLAIWIGIRYTITTRAVGNQKASRELLYTLPWILISLAVVLIISRLGKYGSLTLLIIYAVYLASYLIYLLTWHWRKKQAGYLLLNIGRLLRNKRLIGMTLISVIFASLYSASFIYEVLTKDFSYDSLALSHLAGVLILWSSVIILISRVLSKLEFTENGICYMFSLMKWENITSYSWEKEINNVLIIGFQPRFPLMRSYWRLLIPLNYKDTVNQILTQHLIKTRKISSSSSFVQN